MTQRELISKYGNPMQDQASRHAFERLWMQIWMYPDVIRTNIPSLGKSIYINKDFKPFYEKFLLELIRKGLAKEIKTNDECFMPRYIRGYEKQKLLSKHTWGIAVDLNVLDNPLGMSREQAVAKGLKPFSKEFQQVARDCGLQCGYDFGRIDGMHFELP